MTEEIYEHKLSGKHLFLSPAKRSLGTGDGWFRNVGCGGCAFRHGDEKILG
jgi:hypothetical protein